MINENTSQGDDEDVSDEEETKQSQIYRQQQSAEPSPHLINMHPV